jgi:hypothetical protein
MIAGKIEKAGKSKVLSTFGSLFCINIMTVYNGL